MGTPPPEGARSTADPLIGRAVSHYRIVERLGAGGMGTVYVADDEALGRRVAFKAIRHDRGDSDHLRERFRREARLLSRLDHPNVCRIHDYIGGDREDFLVLELIQGRTLKEHIAEGLERAEALRVAAGIAEALVVAHGQAIVHRDLKPANVMVTDDGVVKVLDFGLARPTGPPDVVQGSARAPLAPEQESSWSSVEATLTEVGTVTGTLLYMSPEQARAEPLTTASDVFSLGVMLQEFLTGARVYPGGLMPVEVWELAKEGRTLPFESRDKELRELVEAMKSRVVSERPTALDVRRALGRLRGRSRRRALQALGATAALVVAGGITKYVVDLDHQRGLAIEARDEADVERGRAVAARDEAAARRDQAEDLLDFVVGDLREKLEKVGRLDVLDDVGDRAEAYFDAVPSELLSDRERLRRSKSLYQVGELRRRRGNLPAALELYEKSLQAVESLTSLDPGDLELLFARGESQFYVGYGLLEQGRADEARDWFQAYLATSELGLELSGGADKWRMEVAMATHNLGVLDFEQGEFGTSLELFAGATEMWRALIAERPGDPDLLVELADVLSWLGKVQLRTSAGRPGEGAGIFLEAARASFEEEHELRMTLSALDPGNTLWESQLATLLVNLGRVERDSDNLQRAREHYARASEISRGLCEQDPTNAEWQMELATHLVLMGELLREEDPAEALEYLNEAHASILELVRLNPTSRIWTQELSQVRDQIARAEAALAAEG